MRTLATPLVLGVTLALAPAAAAGGPVAQAAKTCKVDQSPGAYGPTYTTGLRVRGVSCKNGKGYIGKWDRCRRKNGGRDGRCKRPGNGFKCSESRSNVISTQYDGVVKCTRDGDLVKFRYTQFT
jgi:hypothetical protein